ncbi:MAG: S8 family serine peptidase [Planctomycetota bacterium]
MKRQIPTRPGIHRFPGWSLSGPKAYLLAFGALIFVCSQLTFAQVIDLPGLPDAADNAWSSHYKQGEVIVRFADTGPKAPIRRVIPGPLTSRALKNVISSMAAPGAVVHKEYDRIVPGLTLVKLPGHARVEDALSGFSRLADVLYVEPNYKRLLSVFPNDPNFPNLWGLHNTGQSGGTEDADIDAPEAWDIETGDPSIIVAVIDTGVDYDHPDLADNMWVNEEELNGDPNVDDDGNGYIDDIYGYDFGGDDGFATDDWDNDPRDFYGHGTHVAGTIGAVGDNSEGVTGVCWDVSIMALKFFADNGSGGYVSDEIAAIEYARVMGADVINASFVGYFESQAEYDAIAAADANGILFVAAAGNYSYSNDIVPFYPCSYDLENIISVMATNHDDNRAGYSNFGAISVDIAAPGGELVFGGPNEPGILSTIPGDGYGYEQGTSMAAPHVAGAAALVWSTDPNMAHTEVKRKLLHPLAVDQLPALQGQCVTGGRLNLFNALSVPGLADLVVNTSIPYNSNDPNTFWTTIQAAIDDAINGDELIASPGLYPENIDFLGKNIILRSGNVYNYNDPNINPDGTFIFADNSGSVVTFQSDEGPGTVLKGFTITGGYAEYGGGIECDGASPTITDCTISNNTAVYYGGGIDCFYASPAIRNCIITDNHTLDNTGIGGGVNCEQASPKIEHCFITNNNANNVGGGVACYYSSPSIFNCFIIGNSATYQSGGIDCEISSPTITNCTIFENTAAEGGGILADQNSLPAIKNCIVWGNGDDLYGCSATYSCIQDGDPGTGNINSDPLFLTGPLGDYYLTQIAAGQLTDSPCLNAGNSSMPPPMSLQLIKRTTRTDGDVNNPDTWDVNIIDMGAHYMPTEIEWLQLNTSVVGGNGSIMPDPNLYPKYSVIQLTAIPDPNYRVRAWTGTDDDTSTNVNNTITMIVDVNVTVEFEAVPFYRLRTSVLGGNGTISPNYRRGEYFADGTVVELTATPDLHYIVDRWVGTDDDTSWANTNYVTMDADKDVTVSFRWPDTFIVTESGPMTIQGAISAAYDHGDNIVVKAGEYYGGYSFMGKAITIASEKPDDPSVVAATIIRCGSDEYGNRLPPAFYFMGGEGRDSVVDGFTLQGGPDPGPGGPRDNDNPFVSHGATVLGGAISCSAGSSPTLSHLVIRNVVARGTRGGNSVFTYDPHDGPPDPPDPLDPIDPLPDPCAPEPNELVTIEKWSQTPVAYGSSRPDYYWGWDEEPQQFPPDRIILIDDFFCDSNIPITDIRWWGSIRDFSGDRDELPTNGLPDTFEIRIWASTSPNDTNYPDMSQEVHTVSVDYSNVTVSWYGWEIHPESPDAPNNITKIQYDITLDPNEWWYQPDSNGVFWVSIEAIYNTIPGPNDPKWGWETCDTDPNDPNRNGALRYNFTTSAFEPVEFSGTPWDMSFVLLYVEPDLPIDGNDGLPGLPGIPGIPGPNGIPGANGFDGGDGGDAYGGAMYFGGDCDPLLTNITIINCQALGGYAGFGGQGQNGQNGGNGQIGQDGQPGQNGGPGYNGGAQGAGGDGGVGGAGGAGGRGGDGGDGGDGGEGGEAMGGAIFFGPNSHPTIRYLSVTNCWTNQGLGAAGGNAGNAGNGGNGAAAGAGGATGTGNPDGQDGAGGADGRGGRGGNGGWGGDMGANGPNSLGGAIFYGQNCEPNVTDTTISYCYTDVSAATDTYTAGSGGNGGSGGDGANDAPGGPGGWGGWGGVGDPGPNGGPGGSGGGGGNNNAPDGPDGPDGGTGYSPIYGYGGANYYDANCVGDFNNYIVSYCSTSFSGGAEYYHTPAKVRMQNCQFIGNTGSSGGAQYFGSWWSWWWWYDTPTTTVVLEANDCNYVSNTAYGSGGALYWPYDATVEINNSRFLGNLASYLGGAIYGGDGDCNIVINRTRLIENEARSALGGAMYWGGSNMDVSILDSTVNKNIAEHGGGLFWSNGGPDIIGCTIKGNEALGTYMTMEGYFDNFYGGGGGMLCWSSEANIENCFISDNKASGSGGGVYFGGDPNVPER